MSKAIITVKDMCLWYGETQALKDISLNIEEHSITALIGPSGCGKSTFLKSLNRMNDLIPDVKITGEIRYKDQDIYAPSVDVNELRKDIGMVFQKPNPFPMSIYDNIAYGNPSASREDVIKAAETARVSDFVCKMPDGYDTVIILSELTLQSFA